MRENRNVLCAKGKKKLCYLRPPVSLFVCQYCVRRERREGLFLFHRRRRFTARFIFPKTSALQTGTFFEQPKHKTRTRISPRTHSVFCVLCSVVQFFKKKIVSLC